MIQPRLFILNRIKDATGMTGVGIVAHGTQYPCGKCTVCFVPPPHSVIVYNDISEVIFTHGHGGNTIIEYIEVTK